MESTLLATWAGEINKSADIVKSICLHDTTRETESILSDCLITLQTNAAAISKYIQDNKDKE